MQTGKVTICPQDDGGLDSLGIRCFGDKAGDFLGGPWVREVSVQTPSDASRYFGHGASLPLAHRDPMVPWLIMRPDPVFGDTRSALTRNRPTTGRER